MPKTGMITNTFSFLERIKNETRIWQQGIKDWNSFLKTEKIKGISKKKKPYYDRKIQEAQTALHQNNLTYFKNKLPQIEMWRLYNSEESCYLDIEADAYGKITLVGISNYYNTNFFVKGVNLYKKIIEKELSKFALLLFFDPHQVLTKYDKVKFNTNIEKLLDNRTFTRSARFFVIAHDPLLIHRAKLQEKIINPSYIPYQYSWKN